MIPDYKIIEFQVIFQFYCHVNHIWSENVYFRSFHYNLSLELSRI